MIHVYWDDCLQRQSFSVSLLITWMQNVLPVCLLSCPELLLKGKTPRTSSWARKCATCPEMSQRNMTERLK